jgi:hypothetical protein
LEQRSQAELISRDDFHQLMLGMIAKLTPCSEQRLLDVVAGQASRRSLRSRTKSIRQSVRELQARGFVEIKEDQLVVTNAGMGCLQIKPFLEPMRHDRASEADDRKAAAPFAGNSSPNRPTVREVVATQRHDVEPWEEAASEFEKAVEALKMAEPGAQAGMPLELSPDLALPDAGADPGPLLTAEEKLTDSVPTNQVCDVRHTESNFGPRFAWLIENIPRRMRAQVPVEAEIRVSSTVSREVAADLFGQGKTDLYGIDVGQAMSLRLSAPGGGFIVEAQSPETQWVWRSKSQSVNELAAWRFILTPNRRGFNSLRLTFSYKEIGPNGLLADGALPERMLDVVVSTNLAKTLTQAAVWVTTLVVGAVLGAHFPLALRLIRNLYQQAVF